MLATWTSGRWLLPLLTGTALLLLALAEPGPAMATPDYARATGQACATCHVGQPAAQTFTALGQQFAAIPLHTTDPATAWAQVQAAGASSAPAPVQTPRQLPRTGEDPRFPVAPVALLVGLSLVMLGAVLLSAGPRRRRAAASGDRSARGS